jgi:NAD(P)-dependent dehydrogenase (short-subunit alcohol dehydrogenase family)
MSIHWQDKTALITGANRGIGLGLVQALINKGIKRIYLTGRDFAAQQSLAIQLKNPATELIALQLDVTSAKDIQQAAATISQLDFLFNNAGIATGSGDIAVQEMATNYFGPVNLTRALLPALKKSSGGAIVNVSSIAGIANMPLLGPYSAAKAALHSFTQCLRAELAKTHLLVQGVYPGPIETRLTEGFDLPKATPAEVADVVLAAIENGEEDVFPDAMSLNWYETFKANPKQLEKEYASWLG